MLIPRAEGVACLNAIISGNQVRPGVVYFSLDVVNQTIDTLTGGAGRFVADTLGAPWKAVKGEDVESYEVPLLRKVYGKPGMGQSSQDYDAQTMIVRQFGVDRGRAIGSFRTAMDRMDQRRQTDVLAATRRQRPVVPRIEAALGNLEQPAHEPHRKVGLVCLHKSEERFRVAVLSFANQAAAFDKISRSNLSWRFSRRSRVSSWRSACVSPPSPWPTSRSACLTHCRIDQDVKPNSVASSLKPRPARYSSTIWRRNSGAYLTCFLGSLNTSL